MAIDMKELARRGAEARMEEIREELAELQRLFGTGTAGRRVQSGGGGGTLAPEQRDAKPRRRRKPMSAAQKKAVGIRMKKYWAARRKAEDKS